jgi:hypothetical protein
MFPGCSAQWDAQLCDPVPGVTLFVNGFDSLTAAWVNPLAGAPRTHYTLYAFWDIVDQRWVFDPDPGRQVG